MSINPEIYSQNVEDRFISNVAALKDPVREERESAEEAVVAALMPQDSEITSLDEVADQYRKKLGGKLSPHTTLRSLRFDLRIQSEIRKKLPYNISHSYGRALMAAARRFGTTGKLRESSYEELVTIKGIGTKYAKFLSVGFRAEDQS